jgi:hypothetical protein
MSGWDALHRELGRWGADGRKAALWWRDDDATAAGPELARLLETARELELPLCLAVIPGAIEESLPLALAGSAGVSLLQHGYRHQNHARAGEKKIELGGARDCETALDDLRRGKAAGEEVFAGAWLPVLVPPWNRIAPEIAARLGEIGFCGLSTHGRRPDPPRGVRQVNTHLDILSWRPAPRFAGEEALLASLVQGLEERRREDAAGAEEPFGLLTHHKAHDSAAWRFLEMLLEKLKRHEAVSWKGGLSLFFQSDRGDET